MFCPSGCASPALIGQPTGGCDLPKPRQRTPSRLAMFFCNLALPSPFTSANTTPLFAAGGGIVVSSSLANVTLEEPTTEDVLVDDCTPPDPTVTGRILTFEDRTPVSVPDDPATTGVNEADPWRDWTFWKDKLARRRLLRYGLIYCNGDVHIARNPNGSLMEAMLSGHVAYQRLGTGKQIEFVKGRLAFSEDPLYFNKPDFNLVTFGITV